MKTLRGYRVFVKWDCPDPFQAKQFTLYKAQPVFGHITDNAYDEKEALKFWKKYGVKRIHLYAAKHSKNWIEVK